MCHAAIRPAAARAGRRFHGAKSVSASVLVIGVPLVASALPRAPHSRAVMCMLMAICLGQEGKSTPVICNVVVMRMVPYVVEREQRYNIVQRTTVLYS